MEDTVPQKSVVACNLSISRLLKRSFRLIFAEYMAIYTNPKRINATAKKVRNGSRVLKQYQMHLDVTVLRIYSFKNLF